MNPAFDPQLVRIQPGKGWPSAASLPTLRLDGQGRFAVDRSVPAISAFVDVNGDDALNHFEEPSAPCFLIDGSWRCELDDSRVTVQRIEAGRIGEPPATDNVIVLGESYDASGQPRRDIRFCVSGDDRTCASPGTNPFGRVGDRALAIGPCALQPRLVGNEALEISMMREQVEEERWRLDIPEPLGMTLSMDTVASSLRIRGRARLPLTHAIVWLGTTDAVHVFWSTEAGSMAVRISERELEAYVPRDAIAACGGCKLMVQVASARNLERGAVSYSEGRFFLEPGALP